MHHRPCISYTSLISDILTTCNISLRSKFRVYTRKVRYRRPLPHDLCVTLTRDLFTITISVTTEERSYRTGAQQRVVFGSYQRKSPVLRPRDDVSFQIVGLVPASVLSRLAPLIDDVLKSHKNNILHLTIWTEQILILFLSASLPSSYILESGYLFCWETDKIMSVSGMCWYCITSSQAIWHVFWLTMLLIFALNQLQSVNTATESSN